jgi:hypothetical protein
MIETLTVNVRLPDGGVEKRELTLTPGQDVKANAAGQLVVSGAADEIVLLDATLADIAANTVEVTGPALAETTDGSLVRLPAGSSAGAGNNDDWVEVGAGGVVSTPPSSASDNGTAGEIAYDSNYIYVCVATDTWLRAPIASWT